MLEGMKGKLQLVQAAIAQLLASDWGDINAHSLAREDASECGGYLFSKIFDSKSIAYKSYESGNQSNN